MTQKNSPTSIMRLYLDTADVSQWERLMPLGVFHGITTNPLLAQRAGLIYEDIDWSQMAERAVALGAQELHGQVPNTSENALDWAADFYNSCKHAGGEGVVKIPLTDDGIKLATAVKSFGGKILMTACYHSKQMILASALEADYIAPYFGRMSEAGLDAEQHLNQMQRMTASSKTRILVASLRSVDHILTLTEQGHDCFTISPDLADDLLTDPLTRQAAADFERAAKG